MHRQQSLANPALARYVTAQLNNHFPDETPIAADAVLAAVVAVEERAYRCFTGIRKKYFNEGDRVVFDHLHSDQYAMYLCMLANDVHRRQGDARLSTKLYYLNKVLHGLDVYFTAELPEVFLFVHPVATVLGRAQFADGLVVYQGCTVGCLNDGVFPTFTGSAILYANSSVLGRCRVGRNVCVAAGSLIVNTDVPDDTVVLGRHPHYEFRPSSSPLSTRPPYAYGV
jgi:serine O-acetyltransferase